MFRTALISLFATSTALADYTGLTCTSEVNDVLAGTWTARIYANFDAATDHLSAVFGDSKDPLLITSSNGFYQNPFGGPTGGYINPAFCDVFPSIQLDSWVTICIDSCDGEGGSIWTSGIDWFDFEGYGGDIYTENGSWSASSSTCEYQYLIGQFTMFGLESHVSGVLNLQYIVGDLETFQARGQEFDFFIGPQTWTVDDDGKADFDNIQAAVDAASDGDEIIVKTGTYTGTGDQVVDMKGKAIRLHSNNVLLMPIIDGEGVRRGILCDSGETSKTIIEGFTITNGYSTTDGGGMFILSSSPEITSCSFKSNGCSNWGAGIYMYDTSSMVTDSVFTDNNAVRWGGGIFSDGGSPTFTNCLFAGNDADVSAGGLHLQHSDAILSGCTFTNNTASSNGAGMFCFSSDPAVDNCIFMENYAGNVGGGVRCFSNSDPILTNCSFINNTAYDSGGGMANNPDGTPFISGTDFCGNTPTHIDGPWTDGGDNTMSDECAGCVADLTKDGEVDLEDIIEALAAWGDCPGGEPGCYGDINLDGNVDISDLLSVLDVWGPCE